MVAANPNDIRMMGPMKPMPWTTTSALTPASADPLRTPFRDRLALSASLTNVAAAVMSDKLKRPVLQPDNDVPVHVRDVAYALASALDVDQRRAWEVELIHICLEQLQESGCTPMSFDEAWKTYRLQLLGALVTWTPTYRPPPFMPEMQPAEVTRRCDRRLGFIVGMSISDHETSMETK